MVRERKISPAKQFRAVSLNRGKVVWVKIEAEDEKHLPTLTNEGRLLLSVITSSVRTA